MNKPVLPLPAKAFERSSEVANRPNYEPEQLVLDWLRREIDKQDPGYAS